MQRKHTSEELAQKALNLLNETDKLEQEKNWTKAIEKYKEAAKYLKISGYLTHRIQDIYARITEINNYLKQEEMYLKQAQQAQIEQIQDEAFVLLDGAKRFEQDGFFQDAIQQYMNAIKLLVKSGWTETQLENLKSKIVSLAQNLERQKLIQEQKEMAYSQQQGQIPLQTHPELLVSSAEISTEAKSKALKAYEAKKIQEEKMQNKAFSHIDEAKQFEKDKKFDDAIKNYQIAIEILKSLGWIQQTRNIEVLIKKLEKDKEDFIKIQAQQQKIDAVPLIERIKLKTQITKTEDELRKQKLIEFEGKKKHEEEIQTKAFNLINFGNRLEREKKYDEAIKNFEYSIQLLKEISWDSYVQPIINFISDIKEKQKRKIKSEEIRKKREEELNKLQKTIFEKQKEQFIQTAQNMELRRREFDQKRIKEIEKEKQFNAILKNADKILQEENDYDGALIEYQKAIEILKDLGSGWETYIPTIKTTISNITQIRKNQVKIESKLQKKKEERSKNELEFQKQIAEQIKIERDKIKQKVLELKLRDDELKYREQRKQTGFKFLDAAQNYINQGDFDKAMYAYQNAGNIFAEIQWADELPLIENAIKELDAKRNEFYLLKQKEMQEIIKTKKEEREFQTQITNQLQLERLKLQQKEITLREHENELEYREKRKRKAFQLLEEAQNYLKQGDFDKSIEFYRNTANIFAEIQWHEEINLIQNSIFEIENKKREAKIRKQMDFQDTLERERQENLFQEQLSREMKANRGNLKKKEIILREKEKELEYRTKRKEQAFELLDNAQNLLSQNRFDETIEIYHNVANIFAQIQWIEEIRIIQNAIKEIEIKKKEKELWKQESLQKAIQREISHQTFVEQIKFQREIEKARLMEKQELIEKQKELIPQNLAKQEEAFKIIDEGDLLLKQEYFDEAIEKYQKANSLLSEIGWEPGYLKLLQENLQTIQSKKIEKEKQKKLELEISEKYRVEEQKFQLKITEQIQKEKERMRVKKIEIQKQEALKVNMKKRKSEAFELMYDAETLLDKGQYEQSIDKYRQAELILNEINFPTGLIKETIIKVKEKRNEEDLAKQKEMERRLKREQQEFLFQQQTAQKMNLEKQKMITKQIKIKKQEELKQYMEKRKNDSFNLLEEAEIFMKQIQYDKALRFYHSAELILNEIQYPTESIREMINKVREKKREQEILKQKQFELTILKERENREFQRKIAESFNKEKERLTEKKIRIERKEKMQVLLEKRKNQAFNILDDAKNFIKSFDYNRALECYRKAELILNELHFPTEELKNMRIKIINLKEQKQKAEELELQRELERIEVEKQLQALVEERRRQEKEKKIAQQLAIQERERIIQEQMDQREAAYSLLEEGGKYLKRAMPDYDKAISLYIQARNILAYNIGWEPEINNLNGLIQDLQIEKANFVEKRRLEGLAQLKRQEQYDLFQEEMRRKRADYEIQKDEQRAKLKEFEARKKFAEELRDEGLKIIDEGKRRAKFKEFDKAYYFFNKALSHFKEIGWNEQVRYIETEIKNIKNLEEKFKQEKLEIQKIQEELELRRKLEIKKRKKEDLTIKQTIVEVGDLADEIGTLIESQKQELILTEQQKKEQIQREAKEFSRNMGKMLKIKQELLAELERAKEEKIKKQEKIQKAKDKEELDEIAKMLKEVAKKEKK
jgi:hypothetical protein